MVIDAEDTIASEKAAGASAVLALAGHTRNTTAPAWEKLIRASQEVLLPPAVPSLQEERAPSGSVSRLKTQSVRQARLNRLTPFLSRNCLFSQKKGKSEPNEYYETKHHCTTGRSRFDTAIGRIKERARPVQSLSSSGSHIFNACLQSWIRLLLCVQWVSSHADGHALSPAAIRFQECV